MKKREKTLKANYKELAERRDEILYSREYTEDLFFEYMNIEIELDKLRKGDGDEYVS